MLPGQMPVRRRDPINLKLDLLFSPQIRTCRRVKKHNFQWSLGRVTLLRAEKNHFHVKRRNARYCRKCCSSMLVSISSDSHLVSPETMDWEIMLEPLEFGVITDAKSVYDALTSSTSNNSTTDYWQTYCAIDLAIFREYRIPATSYWDYWVHKMDWWNCSVGWLFNEAHGCRLFAFSVSTWQLSAPCRIWHLELTSESKARKENEKNKSTRMMMECGHWSGPLELLFPLHL